MNDFVEKLWSKISAVEKEEIMNKRVDLEVKGQFILAFWKYREGVYFDNLKTYVLLSKNIHVEGVDELPIAIIKQDISHNFCDWEHYSENSWRSNNGQFEVYTTSQFVRIDCLNMLKGQDMNKFTDIMVDYNCPFYDFKTNRRFDEWELYKGENFFI